MVCPSDHLEPIIYHSFKGQKYFYTSLGNTVDFDNGTLREIAKLIADNDIEKVTFILSENNRIALDALSNQYLIKVRGLDKAYRRFLTYKRLSLKSWQMNNYRTMIISHHLNQKIEEMRNGLHDLLPVQPEINGKVFSKSMSSFRPIYSRLVCVVNSNILN